VRVPETETINVLKDAPEKFYAPPRREHVNRWLLAGLRVVGLIGFGVGLGLAFWK
jgi:hypothetical protein